MMIPKDLASSLCALIFIHPETHLHNNPIQIHSSPDHTSPSSTAKVTNPKAIETHNPPIHCGYGS